MLLTIYNNQLIECEVYGVFTINKETKKKELQECELHHNGKVFNVPKEQLFYLSKEDYEKNEGTCISFDSDMIFRPYHWSSYYYEDGEIKKFVPYEQVRKFKVQYGSIYPEVIDADIPDVEMYHSREELLAFNSYEIVKDNGSIERHNGYMQKLLFNDKQKEIFERLCKVAKEAVDAGIKFMFDRDNGTFFAINNEEKRISEWFAGCEEGYDTNLYVPKQQSLQCFDLYDYCDYDYGINLDKLNGNEK